jgi:hypothetical protein
MTLERKIRLIAGTFILASLALSWWVSPYWFLFTAFVGLNLIQSSIKHLLSKPFPAPTPTRTPTPTRAPARLECE